MDFRNLTLQEFADKTDSKSSVPGGGSVSAYIGVLGAALSGMVAALTVDKSGYEQHHDEMKELAGKAKALQERLFVLMQEDGESFNGYIEALKLPKETSEQQLARKEALQQALKDAAAAPLATAEAALGIMPLAKQAALYGNKGAVTDAVISAMLSRTAVFGALCNVKINLASIKDEEYVAKTAEKVSRLENEADRLEQEILSSTDF